MYIGIFTANEEPYNQALYYLARQFRLRDHVVHYRNADHFRSNEMEPFDGVIMTALGGPAREKTRDAYVAKDVPVFLLDFDGEKFFVGESPKFEFDQMRDLCEWMLE